MLHSAQSPGMITCNCDIIITMATCRGTINYTTATPSMWFGLKWLCPGSGYHTHNIWTPWTNAYPSDSGCQRPTFFHRHTSGTLSVNVVHGRDLQSYIWIIQIIDWTGAAILTNISVTDSLLRQVYFCLMLSIFIPCFLFLDHMVYWS